MKKVIALFLSTLIILMCCAIPTIALSFNDGIDDSEINVDEILPVLPDEIYVASNGNDLADGSNTYPVKTLEAALTLVRSGGKIILTDTISLSSSFVWSAHNKKVTLTGGTLDISAVNNGTVTIGSDTSQRVCAVVNINDAVTFENINIKADINAIFANGNPLKMGEGVMVSGDLSVFGGGNATAVASTSVTLLSGTYTYIFGGSFKGTVNGDTMLYVGGSVNSSITVGDGQLNHAYGGGWGDKISGSTNVSVADSAKLVYVFGGSRNGSPSVANGCNATVSGGTIMNLYGGSWNAYSGKGTNVLVTGGTIEAVFGGNQAGDINGDVYVSLLGGTVTRRIYGGCYNATSSLSFSTDYMVKGNITLLLGENLNFSRSSSDNDVSLFAHSRRKATSSDSENSTLIYDGSVAYSNNSGKIKAKDLAMKLIIGSTSVADNTYTMSYSAQGNVLTQSCSALNHTATATVSVDGNERYVYSGEAITPAVVTFSDGWYTKYLDISYINNINAGTATASITKDNKTASTDFTILDLYTITFNFGAHLDTQTVTCVEGDSITLPDTTFSFDNNWYTDISGDVSTIVKESYTPSSDIALYCVGSLVDLKLGNSVYAYSENYTVINDSGASVIYYASKVGNNSGYASNHFRIGKVNDKTTYKISVTYKANGEGLGFAFVTAYKNNINLYDTALHGATDSALYTVSDTNGDYVTAEMFVTTDLIGTLTQTAADDIKTVLGDYIYLSVKDNNDEGTASLYISDIEVKDVGNVIKTNGASKLTDEAALSSQNQALRYYFNYVTDDGYNIYIDSVPYTVTQRGFIYVNGNFDSYTDNGAMTEGTGSLTLNGQEGLLSVSKTEDLSVCWEYDRTALEMTYSTYIKGFIHNDSRKLMVRGYVTFLVDGQEMTVYSDTVNRSVEGTQ